MICCSFRMAGAGTEYLPLDNTPGAPLRWESRSLRGTGAPDDPRITEITVRNPGSQPFRGVLRFEICAKRGNPRFFMPGYLYGRNTGELPNHGRKYFPRIRPGESRLPESPFFMTRADRLALPVSLVYDEGHLFGISASPWWITAGKGLIPWTPEAGKVPGTRFGWFSGFTCDLEKGEFTAAGYTLGYENSPWLFVQSFDVREREELTEKNTVTLLPGEELAFTARIYDFQASAVSAVRDVLRDVYSVFHEPPRTVPGMTEEKAVRLLSDAISENAWLDDQQMYTGFVYDKPDGARLNIIGSLSWTNGMAVAAPMLLAGLKLGREHAVAQAEAFIRNVLDNSLNPKSGLPFEHVENGVWDNHGWWYDGMHIPGHTGYLCGQAVYYLLKSYQAGTRGAGRPDRELYRRILSFSEAVLGVLNRNLNTEYEYPFVLSGETGAGLEYDSLGSSWCLAATALWMKITGDRQYLETVIRSEQHYYDRFVSRFECTGGPLDTDKAADNEGILAYIRAVRLLHELTEDPKYLARLRDAIEYECSFKLCYNTPVQVPPLSDIGWSSCGGSITSTANPHIHPMSSTVLPEMRYCAEKTGDRYIAERAEDTAGWGLQTFNTREKEYGYGRIGWMSERFCFCEGLLAERYPDGSPASTWFALMSWAAASVIEGYVAE